MTWTRRADGHQPRPSRLDPPASVLVACGPEPLSRNLNNEPRLGVRSLPVSLQCDSRPSDTQTVTSESSN
eukprot:1579337-Rhodomonas_salina.1